MAFGFGENNYYKDVLFAFIAEFGIGVCPCQTTINVGGLLANLVHFTTYFFA